MSQLGTMLKVTVDYKEKDSVMYLHFLHKLNLRLTKERQGRLIFINIFIFFFRAGGLYLRLLYTLCLEERTVLTTMPCHEPDYI